MSTITLPRRIIVGIILLTSIPLIGIGYIIYDQFTNPTNNTNQNPSSNIRISLGNPPSTDIIPIASANSHVQESGMTYTLTGTVNTITEESISIDSLLPSFPLTKGAEYTQVISKTQKKKISASALKQGEQITIEAKYDLKTHEWETISIQVL